MEIGKLLEAHLRETAEQIAALRREIEELKRSRQEVPAEDWITTAVFLKRHAARFTLGQLRWLLFHRRTNGLAPYVKKPGKALLINERLFIAAALQIDVPHRRRGRAA
jgi:FtsZ-binding cell division protein ZapB